LSSSSLCQFETIYTDNTSLRTAAEGGLRRDGH
jgi:hypothetical protein